ncbi:hypothetical protein AOLI_G00019200 [Acnodon oligacanthus]
MTGLLSTTHNALMLNSSVQAFSSSAVVWLMKPITFTAAPHNHEPRKKWKCVTASTAHAHRSGPAPVPLQWERKASERPEHRCASEPKSRSFRDVVVVVRRGAEGNQRRVRHRPLSGGVVWINGEAALGPLHPFIRRLFIAVGCGGSRSASFLEPRGRWSSPAPWVVCPAGSRFD